jgi:hypothetical protein
MATDTALIRVMTRRYSSGLLNFAAHSPEDNQRDRDALCVACQRDGWQETPLSGPMSVAGDRPRLVSVLVSFTPVRRRSPNQPAQAR